MYLNKGYLKYVYFTKFVLIVKPEMIFTATDHVSHLTMHAKLISLHQMVVSLLFLDSISFTNWNSEATF